VRDVLRNVDHHRAGPSRGGDGVGAAHELRNTLDHLDAQDFLDGGAQDVELAALLRHILPRMRAVAVAGDGDERNPGVQRLHQCGDEIGGARAEGGIAQARLARDAGVSIGSECADTLVVDQEVAEAFGAHAFIEWQQLEAAHAEAWRRAGKADHLGDRPAAIHHKCRSGHLLSI
jgi:hypothetical protein